MNVSNLGVGIIISFAFSWPITLLIIGFVPFMIIGGFIQTKMLAGFSGKDKKVLEEAGKVSFGSLEIKSHEVCLHNMNAITIYQKITNEAIGNIRTVVILNKESYFIDLFNDKITQPFK